MGHPTIAIADHGNVQGIFTGRANIKNGMKVIYGLERDIVNDTEEEHPDPVNHIILLVKNEEGQFPVTGDMLNAFSYLGEPGCREAVITNPERVAAQCDKARLFPVPAVYPEKLDL